MLPLRGRSLGDLFFSCEGEEELTGNYAVYKGQDGSVGKASISQVSFLLIGSFFRFIYAAHLQSGGEDEGGAGIQEVFQDTMGDSCCAMSTLTCVSAVSYATSPSPSLFYFSLVPWKSSI